MWLAVQDKPAAETTVGEAGTKRVTVRGPSKLHMPKVDELGDWRWQQSEMSTDLAAKLGFAVGTMSAGFKSRTLIAEFSRSTTIEQDDGVSARYGVAARLVVGVDDVDADASLTIPVLAAQGSLGHARATIGLTVSGYIGDGLAKLLPTDVQDLTVDTYSSLTTNMSQIVDLIGSDKDNIRPTLLGLQAKDDGPAVLEPELARAVGITYALTKLMDGASMEDAINAYHDDDDDVAKRAITDVYAALLPAGNDVARAHAKTLLDNYVLKGRRGGFAGIFGNGGGG
jgi:hypothetical protein